MRCCISPTLSIIYAVKGSWSPIIWTTTFAPQCSSACRIECSCSTSTLPCRWEVASHTALSFEGAVSLVSPFLTEVNSFVLLHFPPSSLSVAAGPLRYWRESTIKLPQGLCFGDGGLNFFFCEVFLVPISFPNSLHYFSRVCQAARAALAQRNHGASYLTPNILPQPKRVPKLCTSQFR